MTIVGIDDERWSEVDLITNKKLFTPTSLQLVRLFNHFRIGAPLHENVSHFVYNLLQGVLSGLHPTLSLNVRLKVK